jgi:hypothetical protein
MRIDEIISAGGDPVFSFEFFPPKTEEGEQRLFEALDALRPLEPSFVSVTWGAGGSTRSKTIDIVTRIRATHGLEAMAHFTCVGATTDDLHAALRQMREAGIENVLALRGDPPQGQDRFVATEGGLSYASSAPAIRRSTPRRPTARATSRVSRRRSTPAPGSSSRSCSSTTPPTSGSSRTRARSGSTCRSSRGSCRSSAPPGSSA